MTGSDFLRVQTLATDYINRSGMAAADFARHCGYAYSSMRLFLSGKYSASEQSPIAVSVMRFLQEHPIEEEEAVSGQIYETGTVRAMREVFARLLDRPQVYMVYAPPGSGKTDIARHLIADHNARNSGRGQKAFVFRVYCRARITPRDLMRRVAAACGTESHTSIDRAIANLRWDYRGSRVVLYFDEAQHLSIECFETVRELLDEDPRFSLCFAGSHELDRIFTKFSGTLEQLERRITDKVTLPPVTRDEAAGIIRSELAEIVPSLDSSLIHQQIELATISVRVERKTQRYISIGRLMASIRETREALAVSQKEANA